MRALLAVILGIATASTAVAGPPIMGTYRSPDGDILNGRFSESWIDGPLAVGNVTSLESYDPSTGERGTQWQLLCVSAVAYFKLYSDIGPDGAGTVVYQTSFDSAILNLAARGPWSDGTNYTAVPCAGCLISTSTYHYRPGGELQGIEETFNFFGEFAQYDLCVFLHIISALDDNTDTDPFPSGHFPPLLNSDCTSGPKTGAWGKASEVIFSILNCPASTEEATWGHVKSLYAE